VDLIAPASRAELAAALRAASAAGRRLLPVGGRTHLAKGNPARVDAALTVTALDRLVEHTPRRGDRGGRGRHALRRP
jgi:FAD/FMN-containing dehydrogenase